MFFTKDTEMLIDFFLNEKKDFGDTIKNRTHKRKYTQLLSKLYYDIKEADLYMVKKKMDNCFHKKIKKIDTISDIPKPSIYKSDFFPNHISKEINIKSTFLLEYKCSIQNHNVQLSMVLFDDIDLKDKNLLETYDKYAYSVYILLSLLYSYSNKKCGNNLHIFIYYTDFKKYLPERTLDIIGPTHVNTGLTNACHGDNNIDNEIIIFRKEEWFKVLIHECFHNLNIDFSTMDLTKTHKEMQNLFPISSEFNIYEAYTEIWANLINCFLISQKYKDNQKKRFREFVTIEKFHSIFQAQKVLFYSLTKEGINNDKNTNVTSYFLIRAELYERLNAFLKFCRLNNGNYVKIKNTDKWLVFLESKNKIKRNTIFKGEGGYLFKNLRMTILELNLLN